MPVRAVNAVVGEGRKPTGVDVPASLRDPVLLRAGLEALLAEARLTGLDSVLKLVVRFLGGVEKELEASQSGMRCCV